VVDDNRDAADSLALLLRLAGQDVRAAYDGPSALAQARDFRPALVFLDIGMPGMDGYEVARRLPGWAGARRRRAGGPRPCGGGGETTGGVPRGRAWTTAGSSRSSRTPCTGCWPTRGLRRAGGRMLRAVFLRVSRPFP